MTPTNALNRPAWQFWMDAHVRAAGVAWENEQRDQARQQQGSAGTGDAQAKQDLVDEQEARADRREQQDGNPGLNDQMDALQDMTSGGDGTREQRGDD